MRPKKTPLRMCAGCGEMKPKKELARVVRAPQKEDESGSPLPPEISLDLTGKKPGRGAYLCLDAQCLKQAERAAQEAQQPAGPLDEKGQPIIVIEEPEEPLPRRKGGGHG